MRGNSPGASAADRRDSCIGDEPPATPGVGRGDVASPAADLAVGGPAVQRATFVRESEAVQLFEARARTADTDFELTSGNVDAVVSICRALDGIPLAIELAAALVRAMSPAEISDRLTDRFGLLKDGAPGAPPRQRALTGALDWSHQLLSQRQQGLFRTACDLRGRFRSRVGGGRLRRRTNSSIGDRKHSSAAR